MAIFSSTKQEVPKRKFRPQPDPWGQHPEFQALKAAITSGKMRPQEQRGMHIDAAVMRKQLGLVDPVRTAARRMRDFIRSLNLEADYRSGSYETDTPGVFALVVTYDPPPAAVPNGRRTESRREA